MNRQAQWSSHGPLRLEETSRPTAPDWQAAFWVIILVLIVIGLATSLVIHAVAAAAGTAAVAAPPSIAAGLAGAQVAAGRVIGAALVVAMTRARTSALHRIDNGRESRSPPQGNRKKATRVRTFNRRYDISSNRTPIVARALPPTKTDCSRRHRAGMKRAAVLLLEAHISRCGPVGEACGLEKGLTLRKPAGEGADEAVPGSMA